MTETLEASADTSDWITCRGCRALVYGKRHLRAQRVCPECGHHERLTARERIEQLLDGGATELADSDVPSVDPLRFVDSLPYPRRLAEARSRTGLDEAVLCVRGAIDGRPLVAVVMDFRFLGGSLGWAVGELITRAAETALRERIPLVMVTASGGARMQEGVIALMQMAKTSQALAELDEAGILTVSVITDPTYGGVAASFAALADVILIEPGARMGFAGPRVIANTIHQRLPDGFQGAGFLLRHGLVDDVVPRGRLRLVLGRLLAAACDPLPAAAPADGPDPLIVDPGLLPAREPWEVVQLSRHIQRPTTLDYIHHLLDGFEELHGDRISGDCPALVAGVGRLSGAGVVVIGHQKGHTTQDLIARNFGMARPAGYRKAARVMRLAEKLRLPVVTLIDTPGAYPGIDAEEGGQAGAIATNLCLMARLTVPVVAVVTGEGGSGGALALGVADRVLMLSNAIYSVISPEGCAAILWRSASHAPVAAAALRLDARQLLGSGVIDAVLPEPEAGAHCDHDGAAEILRAALTRILPELAALPAEELVRRRHRRLRRLGEQDQP